jgi:hypothetical protein
LDYFRDRTRILHTKRRGYGFIVASLLRSGAFVGVTTLEACEGDDLTLYGVNDRATIEVAGRKLDRPLCKPVQLFDDTFVILRHHELLKLKHIEAWIDNFEYTTEFRVPVPFEDRHPIWLDCRKIWQELERRRT